MPQTEGEMPDRAVCRKSASVRISVGSAEKIEQALSEYAELLRVIEGNEAYSGDYRFSIVTLKALVEGARGVACNA